MSGLIPSERREAVERTHGRWHVAARAARRRMRAPPAARATLGDLKEILGIVRRRRWLVLLIAAGGRRDRRLLRLYNRSPVYLATASVRIADARQCDQRWHRGCAARQHRRSYRRRSGSLADPGAQEPRGGRRGGAAAAARAHCVSGWFPASDIRECLASTACSCAALSLVARLRAEGYTLHDGKHEITRAIWAACLVAGITFTMLRAQRIAARRSAPVAQLQRRRVLLDGVDARPRKSTDVVDVTYRANDPFVAQQVVNTIVARTRR